MAKLLGSVSLFIIIAVLWSKSDGHRCPAAGLPYQGDIHPPVTVEVT
jgi:hypothetical protein